MVGAASRGNSAVQRSNLKPVNGEDFTGSRVIWHWVHYLRMWTLNPAFRIEGSGWSQTRQAEPLNHLGSDLPPALNTHLSAPLVELCLLNDMHDVTFAKRFPIQPVRAVEQNLVSQ